MSISHAQLSSAGADELQSDVQSTGTQTRSPRWFADAVAILSILCVAGAISAYKFHFDNWLHELDIESFFLPWFAELGRRLREGDIPARNPFAFSGLPFAGDPESGWGYLPAMLIMALFPPLLGFKILGVVLTLIGSFSTYAFCRVVRLGVLAATFAAIAYAVGPAGFTTTYACFVGGMVSAWIPLCFLGVEIAARSERTRGRLLGIMIGAFALSQVFAAWMGQGAYIVLLMLGGWVIWRYLVNPPLPQAFRTRLIRMVIEGAGLLGLGALYGAGGILPRLAANAQSNIAGGNYVGQLGSDYNQRYPNLSQVLRAILSAEFGRREYGVGAIVALLGVLALLVMRRRSVGWFFALVALLQIVVPAQVPGFFQAASLIPEFRHITDHSPDRILWFFSFPATIVAASAIAGIRVLRGWRDTFGLLAIPPLVVMAATYYHVPFSKYMPNWAFWMPATLTVLVLGAYALSHRVSIHTATVAASIALIALITVFPIINDVQASQQIDETKDVGGDKRGNSAYGHQLMDLNMSTTDPDGVGAFLQQQRDSGQPFRFVSYGGLGGHGTPNTDYPWRRFEIQMSYILQNIRPMRLRLETSAGYDPQQPKVYQEYITALNGRAQNYHYAHLWANGVHSPLLPLLNVRYVVLDKTLDPKRPDVAYITTHWKIVFQTDHAAVYELPNAAPRAWMVYDVRSDKDGLKKLASGEVDGRQVAFVDGDAPATSAPASGSTASVFVKKWSEDSETLSVDQSGQGVLVVSEIYSKDWKVTVDGKKVDPIQTDHALIGVPLTSGKHTVTLHYQPTSLVVGNVTSAVSFVGSLAALAFVWRHDRGVASILKTERTRRRLTVRREVPEI